MGRKTKLNDQLSDDIIALLEIGTPDETMCEHIHIHKATFYNWLKWGRGYAAGGSNGELIVVDGQEIQLPKSGKTRYIEFLDAVTRARAAAKVHSVQAIHDAISGTETVTEIIEHIEEIRLKKDGSEYNYEKTVEKTVTVHNAPEWRAAMEYLERRDPDNWRKQQKIDLEGTLQLSDDVISLLKKMDVDMDTVLQIFENLVREMSDE